MLTVIPPRRMTPPAERRAGVVDHRISGPENYWPRATVTPSRVMTCCKVKEILAPLELIQSKKKLM